jgi:hypothetical protein
MITLSNIGYIVLIIQGLPSWFTEVVFVILPSPVFFAYNIERIGSGNRNYYFSDKKSYSLLICSILFYFTLAIVLDYFYYKPKKTSSTQ